jgi:hypothetical protein
VSGGAGGRSNELTDELQGDARRLPSGEYRRVVPCAIKGILRIRLDPAVGTASRPERPCPYINRFGSRDGVPVLIVDRDVSGFDTQQTRNRQEEEPKKESVGRRGPYGRGGEHGMKVEAEAEEKRDSAGIGSAPRLRCCVRAVIPMRWRAVAWCM